MKAFLMIFVVMVFGSLSAKSELGLLAPYAILSDSASAAVPKGSTLIKGFVYGIGDSLIAEEGIVANYPLSHKTAVVNGQYELLIPASDSVVFFYSETYGEIVVKPYDYIGGHVVHIDFYVRNDDDWRFPDMDKPVIYCYTDRPLTATFDLDIHGDLTFSYPQYQDGWKVNVSTEGQLTTEDGKAYPYLFWEGKADDLGFIGGKDGSIEGFFLQTDSVVNFLEHQLSAIGLNRTEQTDFITYWTPRIIENDYVFIQFLVDEEYAQNVAEIRISPQPDELKRVYMLFSGVDTVPNLQIYPQTFQKLNRNGFTVVEWGGSELNLNSIEI